MSWALMTYLLRICLIGATIFLGGCDNGVLAAFGSTPIKFIVCDAGEKNCSVDARFKDFSSCESYKEQSDMVCDQYSEPGKMTCSKLTRPLMIATHCSK
jgi:hypothetical protein